MATYYLVVHMNTYLNARGVLSRDAWLFGKSAEAVIAFVACVTMRNVCMKSLMLGYVVSLL